MSVKQGTGTVNNLLGASLEGLYVQYEMFPNGINIDAIVIWNEDEQCYVAQTIGAWREEMQEQGVCTYARIDGEQLWPSSLNVLDYNKLEIALKKKQGDIRQYSNPDGKSNNELETTYKGTNNDDN
tara:strand:+ start:1517 stop:1894 length:378 start_codon:yes stop_codon:yes gene_type:complete